MTKNLHAHHKPAAMRFTMADRFLIAGQRLRADETIVASTLSLKYAAQWTQARKAAARG